MSNFTYSRASDKRGRVKGQNNPPRQELITTTDPDDGLLKQQGHGICKGLTTAWVIAFLNGVDEASNPASFSDWFTGIAKWQGTYIKDAGGHIDKHLQLIEKTGMLTGVVVDHVVAVQSLSSSDFPRTTPWAAYCSIWHHDIGFAADGRGNFYIMEPNDGLYVYDSQSEFIADSNGYVADRRVAKSKTNGETFGLWFCTQA
jgi:hypothetical protein